MTDPSSPYSTCRIWTLDRFADELDAWSDRERPPDDIRALVAQWWPGLEHRSEWATATLIDRFNSDDSAADHTDVWGLWVPKSAHDIDQGVARVQCLFHIHELAECRIECAAFHTAPRMSHTEVDQADGMG